MTRTYGRKPGINEHFELRRFIADTSTKLPESWSYESFAPNVFDQGAYGTCVANATAAVQMLYGKKRGHGPFVASRSAIYSQAKHSFEPHDIKDDGLKVTDGLLIPKQFGFVRGESLPYPTDPTGRNTGDLLRPVPKGLWVPNFEESDYFAVSTTSVDDMMRSLVAHGPLIIGMTYPLEWENIGSDGYCDPALAKTVAGGHCIFILAYDQNKFGGAFRIRQSWGNNFGANGDGWIPFSAIEVCPQFWPDEAYTVSYPLTK